MKISKERMTLCREVANSVEIETAKREEIYRRREVEKHLDMFFLYGLLFALIFGVGSAVIDWVRR